MRAAGSYREWILKDYKHLLRIRSLLARGRATMARETLDVIARLFGGTAAAPRLKRAITPGVTGSHRVTPGSRLTVKRTVGVPDPAFWLVMEYWWLGDWRRRPCTLAPW